MTIKNLISLQKTFIAFGVFLGAAHPSFADATLETRVPLKDYDVTVNPLGLALGLANVNFEFGAGESFTVGPTFQFSHLSATSVSSNGFSTSSSTSSTTAFGIGVTSSFFLGAPRFTSSWVVSPYVSYINATAGGSSSSGVSVGADVGYRWFWSGGFNLGLGLGIQYVSLNSSQFALSGVLPSLAFNIGYAF